MKRIFLSIGILISSTLIGQENASPSHDVEQQILSQVPNSPEVDFFKTYGNQNISHYTGKADINIPLYELKGRKISMPINLIYDSSGIKVEQTASWVGLGWNLNLGGAVIRNVNGLPDDEIVNIAPYYKKHYTPEVSYFINDYVCANLGDGSYYPNNDVHQYKLFERDITEGKIDTQIDTYTYSALNISGEFYIDYDTNTAICIKNPNYKIIPHFSSDSNIMNKHLLGFTVVDDQGTHYEFFEKEEKRQARNDTQGASMVKLNFVSVWKLTKVFTIHNEDRIDFFYDDTFDEELEVSFNNGFSVVYSNLNNTASQYLVGVSNRLQIVPNLHLVNLQNDRFYIKSSPLSEVHFNKNKVKLISGDEFRLDLNNIISSTSLKPLKYIQVENNIEVIEKFEFQTSYFSDIYSSNPLNELNCRLKLDKLKIGIDNSKEYAFAYIGNGHIMNKITFGKDFWGYYNGRDYNISNIPKNELLTSNEDGGIGSNRSSSCNVDIQGLGTLKSITYPTKGKSTYIYEVNKYQKHYDENQFVVTNTLFNNFQGGLNSESIFNFMECHPMNEPKGIETTFEVSENNNYNLKLNITNTEFDGVGRPHFVFIAIFKTEDFPTYDACTFFENQNIPLSQYIENYDLINNASNVYNFNINLTPGSYKAILLCNRENLLVDLSLGLNIESQHTQTICVGGLRVLSIEDSITNDEITSKKEFYYFDKINNSMANENSSTLHLPAVFYEMYSSHPFEMNYNNPIPYLRRYGNNLIFNSHNHISYPIVTEVLKDNISNQNLYLKYEFYSTPFYRYYINRPFSDVNQMNGKLIKLSKYNTSKKLVYQKNLQYDLPYVTTVHQRGVTKNSLLIRSTKHVNNCRLVVNLPNGNGYYSKLPRLGPQSNHPSFQWCNCDDLPNSVRLPFDPPMALGIPCAISFLNFPEYDNYMATSTFIYEKLNSIIEKNYYYDNGNVNLVEQTTNYAYETNQSFRLKKKITNTSVNNETLEEIYEYPHDLSTTPFMSELIQQNRIGSPVKITQNKIVNGTAENLSTSEIKYNLIDNKVKVSEVEKKKNANLSIDQQQSFTIDQYDTFGNAIQYSKPFSKKTSIIFAYNHTLPIAKIENIAYNSIPSNLISDIHDATDTNYTEANLITKLNALRAHPALTNTLITTYTHKPLVGVSSVTDPKGDTQTYEYDGFNRLKAVRDKEGNILSENEYHYRPQN
jgi:YD repeat-containing protein